VGENSSVEGEDRPSYHMVLIKARDESVCHVRVPCSACHSRAMAPAAASLADERRLCGLGVGPRGHAPQGLGPHRAPTYMYVCGVRSAVTVRSHVLTGRGSWVGVGCDETEPDASRDGQPPSP
jgi:hypothetical protein